jgi:NAD(P)-dependent dehydrogenase (short-subunit alcohol dehydrogenase family)
VQINDKVVVVTGGGNGIGRALCRRFAVECAKSVVVVDLDAAAAERVAADIAGMAIAADVSREDDVTRVVAEIIERHGAIDLSARTPASPWTATSTRRTRTGSAAGKST